jgi:CRP/FNR family transcriptional regulator, cyclic AMP receptor protein
MTDKNMPSKHWSIGAIAQQLVSNNALTAITTHHAVILAQRMRLCQVRQHKVLFRAGDTNTDFLAFVLDGEAVVESPSDGSNEAVVLNVIGVGDMLGEMGVVANVPRSATVTASSDMMVAILDQTAFAKLIKDAPELACGFLSTLLKSVTDRLRESNRKLQTLTVINKSLFEELEASKLNESELAELLLSPSVLGAPPG